MRRIYARLSYFTIALLLIGIGCKTDSDGNIIIPETITSTQFYNFIFTGSIEGPDGLITYGSDDSMVIGEGDQVIFDNFSKWVKEYSDGKREENLYTNEVEWEIGIVGGDFTTYTGNSTMVTFDVEGLYDVTLRLGGIAEIDVTEATFEGFVRVEPKKMCYLAYAGFSNGLENEFIYFENDSTRLERVNYSFMGDLVEFHLFDYDDEDRLETKQIYNGINEALASTKIIYDDKSNIVNDKTVDVNDNLVFEITYTWHEDNYPIRAEYKQPDGAGGTSTTIGVFTLDEQKHNITKIDFEDIVGNGLGYDTFTFDTNEKALYGLPPLETGPTYLNHYNIKTQKRYDASNTMVYDLKRDYEYFGDEFCSRPKKMTETINDEEPVTVEYRVNLVKEF